MAHPDTKSLTGIRGLAILLVMFSHAADLDIRPHPLIDFIGVGRYGVFLFFVLSAFLLTRQYLQRFGRQPETVAGSAYWRYTRRYLKRRFWRIFPLYSAALLLYLSLFLAGRAIYPVDLAMFAKSLFLIDATGIFWTIPVEFEYYFLLPLVAFAVLSVRRPAPVLAGFAILIPAWSWLVPPHYESDVLPFLPIFLTGSLAAWISDNISTGKPLIPVPDRLFNSVAWISLLTFFALFPHYFRWLSGMKIGNTMFHDRFLFWGLASASLVVATLHGNGRVRMLMENRVLVFWGEISFSAYLGHMVVLKSVHHFLPGLSLATQWWLFVSLTALLAWISYQYLERPAMRMVHGQRCIDGQMAGRFRRGGSMQ